MAIFGVPRETKPGEYRCLTPEVVGKLIKEGHSAFIEDSAGSVSGYANYDYIKVGAHICDNASVWTARNIIKIKEPQKDELDLILPSTNILCFAHWSGNPDLKKYFDKRDENNIRVIPYEELVINGKSPVLREMSLCAGELAAFAGMRYLTKEFGGKGILPSEAVVQILGAGNVGWRAMEVLHKIVKIVYLHDIQWDDDYYDSGLKNVHCLGSSPEVIAGFAKKSDIIICAALEKITEPELKFSAPKLIPTELLRELREVVIVDVVVDEGGNCEASTPKTPDDPVIRLPNGAINNVILYCVSNMPGTVPRSSSVRFSNAVYPFAKALLQLSDAGVKNVSSKDITKLMQE